MSLIDRNVAWCRLNSQSWWNNDDREIAQDVIDKLPSVDLMRHGKWIYHTYDVYDIYKCSECGFRLHRRFPYVPFYKYCPECGAKMEDRPPIS